MNPPRTSQCGMSGWPGSNDLACRSLDSGLRPL